MDNLFDIFIKPIKYILIFGFIFFLYVQFLNPFIHVWQQSMKGQGELAHAEFSRQIATCEAMAKKESSKCLAEAEIIRAEGVAKANKIIGDSLNGNEGYLKYLYITNLSHENDKTVIYIPTEACLPILESQRLNKGK